MKNMKNIKSFKLFENVGDIDDLVSNMNIFLDCEGIYTLPYSYYGDPKINSDFNLYVIHGNRMMGDDKEIIKNFYHLHMIMKEMYNIDIFKIILKKDEIILVLYDYKRNVIFNNSDNLNYIQRIKESFLEKNLPTEVFKKFENYFSIPPGRGSILKELNKGISYSNGGGSNINLYDWIYKK